MEKTEQSAEAGMVLGRCIDQLRGMKLLNRPVMTSVTLLRLEGQGGGDPQLIVLQPQDERKRHLSYGLMEDVLMQYYAGEITLTNLQ